LEGHENLDLGLFQVRYHIIVSRFWLVLGTQTRNPIRIVLANSITKVQHALHSSTSRGCRSRLRHKSSSSFTHKLPRTLELMAAVAAILHEGAGDRDIDTDFLPSKRRNQVNDHLANLRVSETPLPEQASETTVADVRMLKAALAKARADPVVAVALAEREPSGLSISIDRLRSVRVSILFWFFMLKASNSGKLEY
jgi:hypothetical protein